MQIELLGPPLTEAQVQARLMALVRRHRGAGNAVVDLLNLLGGQAGSLLDRLPPHLRGQLTESTARALQLSMRAAHGSRGVMPDQPAWVSRWGTAALGAAGGIGGLPTALAELPVTTTMLLRAIQDMACAEGFDPAEPGVQYDCIHVFGAAGPMAQDDGADLGFISTRLALTGGAVQGLIARVAPRLATVLGQKLAAQTVPVLGAAAGAATNYAYAGYYQQMAQVHFGLRRLAIEADRDMQDLVAEFRTLAAPAATR